MNGERKAYTNEILIAIENGTLSHAETERRLQALIDAEAHRTDGPANMELIRSCQSLMWELTMPNQRFESHSEINWAAIQKQLKKPERGQRIKSSIIRVTVAVAVFIFLVAGLGGVLHWEWLHGNSSPDGQQYAIHGLEIDAQLISQSIAEHQSNFTTFESRNYSTLQAFLGFDPSIPQQLNCDWQARNFFATITPDMIYISTSYLNNEEPYELILDSFFYTSVENAYITLEQNQTGEKDKINGFEIYLSENQGCSVACWIENNLVLILSGECDYSEIRTILESELGGSKH